MDFCLRYYQGNLLRGIDNCSGATRTVVQVRLKALDNTFTNNFALFQLKRITRVLKTLCNYDIINKLFYQKNSLLFDLIAIFDHFVSL